MRERRFTIMTGFAVLVWAGIAATAEGNSRPPLGTWLTEDGEARVKIERCAEGLCGTIVWMADPVDESGAVRRDRENPDPALRNRPVNGLTIMRIDDEPDGEGVWRGGRIYDPESGRTYRCTLRRDGDGVLRMRGYLGISLLGRTTRWTRLPDAEPPSLVTTGR